MARRPPRKPNPSFGFVEFPKEGPAIVHSSNLPPLKADQAGPAQYFYDDWVDSAGFHRPPDLVYHPPCREPHPVAGGRR